MVLVSDNESSTQAAAEETVRATAASYPDNDLEDGEIEDYNDEMPPPMAKKPKKGKPPKKNLYRRGHVEKKKKKQNMTKSETSILPLRTRKRKRMQRKKWEKCRKDQQTMKVPADDFAIKIEKAIASVLKQDKNVNDGEKQEEKRGNKRKNQDNEHQNGSKQRKLDFPKPEEVENSDIFSLRNPSPKGEVKKNLESNRKKTRGQVRDQKLIKDQQGVCVFFLQGKCQKNDCAYSHNALPPMKLELCKFYLRNCCAKGEKCTYMHSEFPCKFYHTGSLCLQGDNCKFNHGGPLDEHRRQILFKHITTAPSEILGGFPNMGRVEALNKINMTQQHLIVQYGGERDESKMLNIFDVKVPGPMEINSDDSNLKHDKPSRCQDPEPMDPIPQSSNFSPMNPFASYGAQDQDIHINGHGDTDMRTIPPLIQIAAQSALGGLMDGPNLSEQQSEMVEADNNINWYSAHDDDDDENRLIIEVDTEEEKKDDQSDHLTTIMSRMQIKPQEVVEKPENLSKIDIFAKVTKLLTLLSQQKEAAKAQQQMIWKLEIVEIPRTDYSSLKLNFQDAEKTSDPRLRKIFRLSTEEKDSPASPKASPKATSTRIDPRLKKIEDSKQQDTANLTYTQQLNILHSSAFFQSLTTTQKLLLNQAPRNNKNGFDDPILNSMLSNLNLNPNNMSNPTMGVALNNLANLNKLNTGTMMGNSNPAPMMIRQNPNMMKQMVQPGLRGAAPGIPNHLGDFPPRKFDPRGMNNGSKCGNNFHNNFGGGGRGGFDDYYPPPQDNFHSRNRDNRDVNRYWRKRKNNFNKNNGNRNFWNRN